MPQIPRYDEQRVSTNALPGQRQQIATPDAAFGSTQAKLAGDLADVAGDAGDAFAKQFIEQQKLADDTTLTKALHEAEIDYQKGHAEILQNTKDYVGPGAKFIDKGLSGALLDKSSSAYAAKAATIPEHLRAAFIAKAQKAQMAIESNAVELEAKANNRFILGTANNSVETARSALINIPATDFSRTVMVEADGTPKTHVDIQLDNIDSAVDLAARAQGLDSEGIVQLRSKISSQVLGDLVNRALDDDQPGAANYLLGKYEGRIDADVANKLKEKVAEGDILNTGVLLARKGLSAKTPLPQIIAEIEKANDPGRSEKLTKVVRQKYAEDEQVRNLDMRTANDEGLKYMQDNGARRPPSAIWDRMDPKVRDSILESQQKVARGEHIVTDPEVYAQIDRIIESRSPEMYSIDWAAYSNSLSLQDRKTLEAKVSRTLAPDATKDPVSASDQASAVIKSLGVTGTDEGAFRMAYNDEIAALSASTGKAPTYEDRAKILTRLSLPTAEWSRRRLFKVPKGDRPAVELAIPDADEKRIRKMLEEQNAGSGHEIDDHDIQRQWHIENGIQ